MLASLNSMLAHRSLRAYECQQRTDCHMMMVIKLRTDASMFSHEQQYQSRFMKWFLT